MEVRFSDVVKISKDTLKMKSSFFSTMFFLQGLHTIKTRQKFPLAAVSHRSNIKSTFSWNLLAEFFKSL